MAGSSSSAAAYPDTPAAPCAGRRPSRGPGRVPLIYFLALSILFIFVLHTGQVP